MHSLHCIMYTIQCTLYTVQCKVYSVLCTLHSVYCTLYSVHRTVYTEHPYHTYTYIVQLKYRVYGTYIPSFGHIAKLIFTTYRYTYI